MWRNSAFGVTALLFLFVHQDPAGAAAATSENTLAALVAKIPENRTKVVVVWLCRTTDPVCAKQLSIMNEVADRYRGHPFKMLTAFDDDNFSAPWQLPGEACRLIQDKSDPVKTLRSAGMTSFTGQIPYIAVYDLQGRCLREYTGPTSFKTLYQVIDAVYLAAGRKDVLIPDQKDKTDSKLALARLFEKGPAAPAPIDDKTDKTAVTAKIDDKPAKAANKMDMNLLFLVGGGLAVVLFIVGLIAWMRQKPESQPEDVDRPVAGADELAAKSADEGFRQDPTRVPTTDAARVSAASQSLDLLQGTRNAQGLRFAYRCWVVCILLTVLCAAAVVFGSVSMGRAQNSPRIKKLHDDWFYGSQSQDHGYDNRFYRSQSRELEAFKRYVDALQNDPEVRFWRTFAGGAVLLLCLALLILPVCFCVMLYKLWAQVQDGAARATPGQAVGYLFIPFYNFYWIFVATTGLVEELNRCARRRNLGIKSANKDLMQWYCLLTLASMVPYLGLLAQLINIFVGMTAFNSAIEAAVALALAAKTRTEIIQGKNHVRCLNCAKLWPVKEELAGQSVRCPACKEMMHIPAAANDRASRIREDEEVPAGVPAFQAGTARMKNDQMSPESTPWVVPMDEPSSVEEEETGAPTRIEITLDFFPLAFLLFFCFPRVVIDGMTHKRYWGVRQFDVEPGKHDVTVFFKYFFIECGTNSIEVLARKGRTCGIKYYMPPWMFAKGDLQVDKTIDIKRTRP